MRTKISGTRRGKSVSRSDHAYSPQRIEDEWGTLTDQPIDYAHELQRIDESQFRTVWVQENVALI